MSKKKLTLEPNTVLIALINKVADFKIAQEQNWYRIPKGQKTTPNIVKDKSIQTIAFYHTSVFKNYKYTIRFQAAVKNITIATRQDLFPNEPPNTSKSHKIYYKLALGELQELPRPIISKCPRRILFIPTTKTKFINTTLLAEPEINFLFNDSPLENLLYKKLLEQNIFPERQYHTSVEKKNYILDFYFRCKNTSIDIECDGMKYHYTTQEQRLYDNERNNQLATLGWSVLRFPTKDLVHNMKEVVYKIKKTIGEHGGPHPKFQKATIRFGKQQDGDQLSLFD